MRAQVPGQIDPTNVPVIRVMHDAKDRDRGPSPQVRVGTRGRKQTPAEVVLRLLILKHSRNWGFETLEQEVRANLVYREFTRIGTEKVPDAKVLAKIAPVIGTQGVHDLHRRGGELAREEKLVAGRRSAVGTTVG